MMFTEQEEHGIIVKLIIRELNDSKIPGMFWGQLKRMKNQGITNHQIRIGLELLIADGKLNKRSGLKHVPDYIGEAIRLENMELADTVKMVDKKIVKVPMKLSYSYRNKKLKDWSK